MAIIFSKQQKWGAYCTLKENDGSFTKGIRVVDLHNGEFIVNMPCEKVIETDTKSKYCGKLVDATYLDSNKRKRKSYIRHFGSKQPLVDLKIVAEYEKTFVKVKASDVQTAQEPSLF